jgi:hypothetical protein
MVGMRWRHMAPQPFRISSLPLEWKIKHILRGLTGAFTKIIVGVFSNAAILVPDKQGAVLPLKVLYYFSRQFAPPCTQEKLA